MIAVNTPINIQGKQCILMRDLLGSAPDNKYTSQEQGGLQVWYEEESLRETREGHPDTPVFGFWQTLIASGLIDTQKSLQFIFTTESRDFGYYLYSRGGVLHTGSLFQDELQRLPGPAIADGVTIEDGEEISVELEELQLPQHPLRTHKERVRAVGEQKKKTQQRVFLAAAAIVGLGLVIDTTLAYRHDNYMQDYQLASAKLHIAEQSLAAINKQKMVNTPDQHRPLALIYQVSDTLADSKLSGEISLLPNKSPAIEVLDTPNRDAKLIFLAQKGIQATAQSANKTIIHWVNEYEK